MPARAIPIVVAAGSRGVRQRFGRLISRHPAVCRLVGECSSVDELLRIAGASDVGVLLLDCGLLQDAGPTVLREVAAVSRLHVVVIGDTIDDGELVRWLRHGVVGVVTRDATAAQVTDCLRRVCGGEHWMDRRLALRTLGALVRREAAVAELSAKLTAREFEVMRLVALGFRNREVAGELFVSEGTVKVHLHSVYAKLGVGDRAELSAYARQRHLL